jgi:hypothetical protein
MEELGNQIGDVMLHFNMKTFIGLGVGVGANILVRFALAHPEKVIDFSEHFQFPRVRWVKG